MTKRQQATSWFWGLLAILVAVSVFRVMIVLGAVAVEYTCAYIDRALLRKNIFEGLLARPNACALAYPAGEIVNRLGQDTGAIAEYIRFTLLVVGMSSSVLVAVLVMLSINVKSTLIAILPIALTACIVNMASSRIEEVRRASRAASGQVTAFLGEALRSAQAIKIAGAEARAANHFRQLSEMRRKAALHDRMFNDVVVLSLLENMASLSTGVILLVAARSMSDGTFTVGDFSLFVYFVTLVTSSIGFFGVNLAMYKQTGVAFERVAQLLPGATPESVVKHGPVYLRGPLPEARHIPRSESGRLSQLEVSGLTYHYPGTGRGIEQVSLKLNRGSVTIITGRVGSGKTTLLRALLGLLPGQEGEIRWNGELVEDPARFFVPPLSAYTPQMPHLFSDTIKNNILMGLPEDKVDLPSALRLAVMERDLLDLENGLETVVGPRGAKLSGGQAQRTAAARMFVREPELLVFDDLSSALDVETESLLWASLFERPGLSCLAVSHRRQVLSRADNVILLKDGRIEAEGKLDALLETCEDFRRIL
jgi:ATP-binding cassette subfamily B protein